MEYQHKHVSSASLQSSPVFRHKPYGLTNISLAKLTESTDGAQIAKALLDAPETPKPPTGTVDSQPNSSL